LEAPEKKFFGKYWAPYDAPRHLYHFNIDTLEKLFLINNFKIIKKYSLYQDTPYNILLSMKKNTFYNILKSIFIYLYSLMINILRGPSSSSSMLIVCKKL
jgi:hypothetical protein